MSAPRIASVLSVGLVAVAASGCISEQRTLAGVVDDAAVGDTGAHDAAGDTGVDAPAVDVVAPGCPGCDIGGACVAADATHPDNPCLACLTDASRTGWSPRVTGAPCADAYACTTTACDGAGSCELLSVAVGCFIEDRCWAPGASPEGAGCLRCAPDKSRRYWTPLSGVPCSDGDACTVQDTCVDGQCAGDDMDCDDGLDCTVDSCVNGGCRASVAPGACAMDGACWAVDDVKPGEPCQSCTAADPRKWTLADTGTACDLTDETCAEGVCSSGACGFDSWINADDSEHTNNTLQTAQVFPNLGVDKAQSVVQTSGQLNPQSDIDWFSYATALKTPNGPAHHFAELRDLPTGSAYSVCVLASCGFGMGAVGADVSCADGQVGANLGSAVGCCDFGGSDDNSQSDEDRFVSIQATCPAGYGPFPQGQVYVQITTSNTGEPQMCGGYVLNMGVSVAVEPPTGTDD